MQAERPLFLKMVYHGPRFMEELVRYDRHLVPGIDFSNDPLLQGRLFSYPDTQRHRLGPNFHQITVNAPKATKENSYQRDGPMRSDNNGGSKPNYWPNSFGGPVPDSSFSVPPSDVAGMATRHVYELSDVDFVQADALFSRVMTDMDRGHLIGNIVPHLGGAQKRIQLRQCALFYKVNARFGEGVARGLGLDIQDVQHLAAMSQEERVKATGR